MAAKKTKAAETKTVAELERELAEERRKWEERRKELDKRIATRKKDEENLVKQLVGGEVLAVLGGWRSVDFDALSLALAELPALVAAPEDLDASEDAAYLRVERYVKRMRAGR